MKQEYKKELENIQKLLKAEDIESKRLGLNMFYTSKWTINIKKRDNYTNFYIMDIYEYKENEYTNLDIFFDENSPEYPDMIEDSILNVSDLIDSLLEKNAIIISMNDLEDFS